MNPLKLRKFPGLKPSGSRIRAMWPVVILCALLCSPWTAQAQTSVDERVITGTVVDALDKALPGVTVLLKGTKVAAYTNEEGAFQMKVPKADRQVLSFSFMGMKTQEVVLGQRNVLHIVMEDDATQLENIVVTGIYSRSREDFTGSATTYNAKELKKIGNNNILASLKTLDPAFAIIENDQFGSDPNRLPDIEIRGKSSVIGLTNEYGTDPNQPLFILDGFESSLQAISDLSMDRVESITILKDAAATAIYGSKAANGIVVVETVRPEAGQLKVNYNGNFGVTWADLTDYNLMNAREKLTFERLSGSYGSTDPEGEIWAVDKFKLYNNRLADVARGVDTYWLNEPLRLGYNHRHNVFVEGGDQSMRYGAGVTYGKTQGVMLGSDRDVLNANIRLMYRKGRFSFTNSFNFDYSDASREPVSFSRFARTNPYYRKYDENGDPLYRVESYQYLDLATFSIKTVNYYSPLHDFENNNFDYTRTTGFTNNFEADWRILDELRLRAKVGVTKSDAKTERFQSPFNTQYAETDPLLKGEYYESNAPTFNYNADASLTYGKLLADKHQVNAVAGFRMAETSYQSSYYVAKGFIDDDYANPSFSLGYQPDSRPGYSDSKRREASFYVNLGYVYDNRYMLDATLRSDGSSVFGTNKQFTNTWSVGLGWNLHNENFLKNADFIDQLKLRASMGNPGNQNFDAYIAMKIFQYNNHHSNPFGVSAIIDAFGNPNLKWQKTLDRNIGLDATFMGNRLRVNLDYFLKNTDPLLVYMAMPSSIGTTSVPRNLGSQLTKGYTVQMNYNIIRKDDFMWSVNAHLRHLKATYQDVESALSDFNAKNQSLSMNRFYDGGSPSDLWAVRSAGIDAATGREVFIRKDGTQTFKHNYEDEVVVGNSDPTVEGIIGTSFYYKGFSFSMNFRYRVGGQIFLSTLYNKVENINSEGVYLNQDKRALYDRWKKPGDNAKFKAISTTTTTPMSSRFVHDNNIFSGESISVGYELYGRGLERIGASSLNIRAYMNDIFRISTVINERGIDYPFARSVSMSVGIRF